MPGGGYQGHRKDEWTDFEHQVVIEHATDPDYIAKCAALLPLRTRYAIMNRMVKVRAEAGIDGSGGTKLVEPDLELMAKLYAELGDLHTATRHARIIKEIGTKPYQPEDDDDL